MLKIICLIGLFLSFRVDAAPSVINNFNGQTTTQIYDQISHYDVNGNRIDAHDGMTLQVAGVFYLYGTAYGCGYIVGQVSQFCGFKVYSSIDMLNWTDLGYLFDASITFWQDRCGGQAPYGGCYRAHMIYNQANNNYVLWFNQGPNTAIVAPNSYFVFVCATPVGSCVKQPDPTGPTQTGNGDFAVGVDGTGAGYIAYSNNTTRHILVQALNANYTDSTGPETDTGALGEGTGLFFRSGITYVVYGGAGCFYCVSNDTTYVSAATPLGVYGAPVTINPTSCGGQPRSVDVLTVSGQTTYLYSSDQWNAEANEGSANLYYEALTFTGSAINVFACSTQTTIAGLTTAGPPAQIPTPDQTSVAQDKYVNYQIDDVFQRMQTFRPTGTTLGKLSMPLGQKCYSGACYVAGLGNPLVVRITTLDGSKNPLVTLGSVSLTSAQLSWSQTWKEMTFNLTGLTPGAEYGIVLSNTGTQNAGSVALEDGATSTYPAGVQRFSGDGGVTWSTELNRALMFSTTAIAPPSISGGRRWPP